MALKKEPSKSSLSPELLNQFQSNFSDQAENASTNSQLLADLPHRAPKKTNYKNIFNVHMGTGDKARLKAFCAERELPINTFILFAIENLINEIEDGKCSVSKSGIRVIKSGN